MDGTKIVFLSSSLLSTLMRSRQSFSFPNSQGACLKQFGGNWMKRNKWVNIAVYGWLSQTHRQWLEAHSPLYAHSKKITEFHSNLAPNRRRTCSGLGCQLCHLLIFIRRKNKTDFFFFNFILNKVSVNSKQVSLASILSSSWVAKKWGWREHSIHKCNFPTLSPTSICPTNSSQQGCLHSRSLVSTICAGSSASPSPVYNQPGGTKSDSESGQDEHVIKELIWTLISSLPLLQIF